jgi:hypothetical protein
MKLMPWFVLVTSMASLAQSPMPPASVHYYVQLVWGTNQPKPAKADFQTAGPKLREELARVFKWQNYWEMTCQELTTSPGKPARVKLSTDCEVEIELISPDQRETRIYGKGVLVTRSRRKIHCRNLAIHGGTIPTGGSWFVVVREDKPLPEE